MTPRPALALLASALLLAGCGGSSAPSSSSAGKAADTAASDAASPTASAASKGGGAASGQVSGSTTGGAGSPAGTTGSGPGSSPGSGTAPAAGAPPANPKTSTAPGTYTYDTSGTVTVGTPQDAAGTATLTVDPPAAGQQHSLLEGDQGRTEQDVVVRRGGTFLVRLAITNPAFSKEFRPTPPVLLVPDPASNGRSWTWTTKSTDGKTTVTVTARVARQETLTIGGARTPTAVVTSTLELTGDVTYTGRMETWYDAAHRLTVKEHARGEGTFGGVAFTTDVTSVVRSTRPS